MKEIIILPTVGDTDIYPEKYAGRSKLNYVKDFPI